MASKNIEMLKKAHTAYSARNLGEAEKLVAQTTNFTDHGQGQTASSRAEFRGWLESLSAMSSDVKLVDVRYIDAGEWVIAQFRAVGTQDGPMASFPASNKPFSLDVCEMWRFNANGEAVEGHNYSDSLGLLIQLGHIQPPA